MWTEAIEKGGLVQYRGDREGESPSSPSGSLKFCRVTPPKSNQAAGGLSSECKPGRVPSVSYCCFCIYSPSENSSEDAGRDSALSARFFHAHWHFSVEYFRILIVLWSPISKTTRKVFTIEKENTRKKQ